MAAVLHFEAEQPPVAVALAAVVNTYNEAPLPPCKTSILAATAAISDFKLQVRTCIHPTSCEPGTAAAAPSRARCTASLDTCYSTFINYLTNNQ